MIRHTNRSLNSLLGIMKGVRRPGQVLTQATILPLSAMFSTTMGRKKNNMDADRLEAEVRYFARKKQVSVDLKTLMETGQGKSLDKMSHNVQGTESQLVLMQVACFLHRELPVRLAHRAIELESTVLASSKHIQEVCSWYKQSFKEIRECELPMDVEKEARFAQVIDSIYLRHSTTLMTMAKGAHEIRSKGGLDIREFSEQEEYQRNLDDFYMSRIGVRMLIGQYLALREARHDERDTSLIGMVDRQASPYLIAQQAIDDATFMCTRQHGDAPEVHVVGRTDLTLPYVPSHISYIMLELLKNSMRATVEEHGIDNMPPVKIVIADDEDNEDVAIKISDEGGGIKRSNMDNVWSYLFTTADPGVLESMLGDAAGTDFGTEAPLAGLGYGLPIARNYARYFGGDLTLMSMEGYGTDSYIYLSRLGNKTHYLA